MSYLSFRYFGSFGVRVYDLSTEPSRMHSERSLMAAIRKYDPFQDSTKHR